MRSQNDTDGSSATWRAYGLSSAQQRHHIASSLQGRRRNDVIDDDGRRWSRGSRANGNLGCRGYGAHPQRARHTWRHASASWVVGLASWVVDVINASSSSRRRSFIGRLNEIGGRWRALWRAGTGSSRSMRYPHHGRVHVTASRATHRRHSGVSRGNLLPVVACSSSVRLCWRILTPFSMHKIQSRDLAADSGLWVPLLYAYSQR